MMMQNAWKPHTFGSTAIEGMQVGPRVGADIVQSTRVVVEISEAQILLAHLPSVRVGPQDAIHPLLLG